jgi:hypothetical protein
LGVLLILLPKVPATGACFSAQSRAATQSRRQ